MTKETTETIERARLLMVPSKWLPDSSAIVELADVNARLVAMLRESVGADGPACGSTCVAPDDAELVCDLPAGHGERLCTVRALRAGQRGYRYMWLDPDRRRDNLAVRTRALLAEIGESLMAPLCLELVDFRGGVYCQLRRGHAERRHSAEPSRPVTEEAADTVKEVRSSEQVSPRGQTVGELAAELEEVKAQNADLLLMLEHSATHKALAAMAAENAQLATAKSKLVKLLKSWAPCNREHELPEDGRGGPGKETVFKNARRDLLAEIGES